MKKNSILLLLLFLISFPLFPQQNTKKTLNLKQAVEIALEKNIDVIKAQNSMEIQQSAVTTAYGNFAPALSLSAGWDRSQSHNAAKGASTVEYGGASIPVPPTPAGITSKNNWSTGLNARVVIWDGFANTAQFNRASSNATSSEYGLYRTKQTIVYLIQTKYLTVLRTKSLLKVSEDNLKRSQRQLERIVESNKVGAVAIADVYRQQVQTANDELSLIRAQNSYDNAKADLQFTLALNVSEEYEFEDPTIVDTVGVLEGNPLPAEYSDFPKMVLKALAARPDYEAAKYAKASASSSVTIARSTYFPTISANAGYSLSDKALSKISNSERMLNWGIGISIPLFDGFQRESAVQTAQLQLRNAEEQLSQAERQVMVDVRKAMLDYESARKQLDVTQKNVKSAEEDRRIAEERYNLGANTLLDLLVATANYTTALSNRVNGAYDYLLARQQLSYVIGEERY